MKWKTGALHVWNSLPNAVRNSALSEDALAKLLKTHDELYVDRGAFNIEFALLNKLIITDGQV